jgi:AcrR family transcriptional regulator
VVPTETRSYRSELRAEQAAQTRARVVAAAAALFAEQGYQATTLPTIARRAGVSVETVKASASKAELLLAAFEVTFAGREGAASLTETDQAAGSLELSDEAFVSAVVSMIASSNARAHALWTVLSGAALSDHTVDGALQDMLRRRRTDFQLFASELVRRGLARSDLDVDSAADRLSFLLSPEGYQQLVTQSGWDPERYEKWLLACVASVDNVTV